MCIMEMELNISLKIIPTFSMPLAINFLTILEPEISLKGAGEIYSTAPYLLTVTLNYFESYSLSI